MEHPDCTCGTAAPHKHHCAVCTLPITREAWGLRVRDAATPPQTPGPLRVAHPECGIAAGLAPWHGDYPLAGCYQAA